ncbi:hypothetical protein [Actinokineospora enzanensis]|uniref:hypothetical protein n=1 Tax=Actinokineospora enzanensis TaxID=155975 RepID=UPI000362EF56|nr:hypothetical protein [Actinokineospora enzanensis]
METRIKQLFEELKQLRRGLGIRNPALLTVAGPAVRRACGVVDADSSWTAREKIVSTLERLLDRMPEPSATIGRVALGFTGPDDLRYMDRLQTLTGVYDRDIRTLQRRSDEAMRMLAELAVSEGGVHRALGPEPPWHTRSLRIGVLLDGPEVEVTENRRITSHIDGLDTIEHSLTIAPTEAGDGPLEPGRLGIRAISGGDVLEPRLVTATRVAFDLCPPRPLAAREEHEFEFRVQLPEISPFYVCTPHYRCDEFTLRVRFDRARLPSCVWVVDGSFAHEADDPTLTREVIVPDSSGEVTRTFEHLGPFRSYGLLWRPAA